MLYKLAVGAQIEKLPRMKLNAIWLYEHSEDEEKLEWMLLTNIEIDNADRAVEVGQ